MLNSVIYARDKWLRQDGKGLMYPSIAYMYVCPVEMTDYLNDNLNYWLNYYQLNYEPVMKVMRQTLLEKPIVELVKREQLIDEEKIYASLDLSRVTLKDMEMLQQYGMEFSATRDAKLHGFCFWFDVIFLTDDEVVTLSTSPAAAPTHWKQTITLLPNALQTIH